MKHAPILSEQELEALLASIAKSDYEARNQAIILLSIYNGLRQGEIANLQKCSVVDEVGKIRDWINIPSGKSKESRTVPLHPRCREALEIYLRDYEGDDKSPLFTSSRRQGFGKVTMNALFRRIYDKAGLFSHTSHSGRRTFATNLHENNTPIKAIQLLMGHQHMQTTQIYIDTNPNTLQAAVRGLK